MRTKKCFYMMILALTFSAFVSGGCGGSSGGSLGDAESQDGPVPAPYEISNFSGLWRIVSGEALIDYPNVSLYFSADLVPSDDYPAFTFELTSNGSNGKYTIALSGDRIQELNGRTFIDCLEFNNENIDDYSKPFLDTLGRYPLVIGSTEYVKMDMNIYSFDVAPYHSSVFTFTGNDSMVWEMRGNMSFYMVINRVGDVTSESELEADELESESESESEDEYEDYE